MKTIGKIFLLSFCYLFVSSCHDEVIENGHAELSALNFTKSTEVCDIEIAFPTREKTIVQIPNGLTVECIIIEDTADLLLDTTYILGGDIILSKEQIGSLYQYNAKAAMLDEFVKLWPHGIVRYHINNSLPDKQRFYSAVEHWEANTSLEFIEMTNPSGDYIEVINGNGCYSFLGKIGGRQELSLGTGCSVGNAIHEIGHAVGMFHEHTRTDRDQYITIYPENIENGRLNQFEKYNLLYDGFDYGTFDFSSIMLYSSFAFALDYSRPSMTKKDGSYFYGQRVALSSGDIAGISYIYGPPFAKIERTLIDSEEEVNPMWDKYEATYNETIYLYSDKDCTIPYTAPSDRRLYVEYSETTMNGTTSRIRTLNVPAGASSFYLGQTRLYEENNMGNRVDYYSDRYDIVGPGI